MANIKDWYQPETTKKAIYEGIYPAIISMAKVFSKEAETDDGVKFQRRTITLTFKSLSEVQFPDGTTGNIVVDQNYFQDKPFCVNSLNGLARAAGLPKFEDTDQLEAKLVMIGLANYSYTDNEGTTHTQPQMDLFTYAPISEDKNVVFIATDYPNGGLDKDDYKKWFKEKIALYKQPK